MKLLKLALGLTFLFTIACYRSSNNSRSIDHQIEWGYQLIDQRQYTDAIHVFEDLLTQQDASTIRLGLASAYAARAGIDVQSYWDFIFPSVKLQPPQTFASTEEFKRQWQTKLGLLPPELQGELLGKDQGVIDAFNQLETLKWRFQSLPAIETPQQREDIAQAWLVIKNLPSKGAHLYRALLGLILIRYESNQLAQSMMLALSTQESWPCSPLILSSIHRLPDLTNLVSEFISDLMVAYPNRNQEFSPFVRDFESHRAPIQMSLSLLEPNLCSRRN